MVRYLLRTSLPPVIVGSPASSPARATYQPPYGHLNRKNAGDGAADLPWMRLEFLRHLPVTTLHNAGVYSCRQDVHTLTVVDLV